MPSSSSYEIEIGAGVGRPGALPPAAGVRAQRPVQEPPGVFAVVEMTVLVLVTALAMVAVIVSSNADASPQARPRASDPSTSIRPAAHRDPQARGTSGAADR